MIVEAQAPLPDGPEGERRSKWGLTTNEVATANIASGNVSAEGTGPHDVGSGYEPGDIIYKLPPSHYHLSPAWHGTGQEYVGPT